MLIPIFYFKEMLNKIVDCIAQVNAEIESEMKRQLLS